MSNEDSSMPAAGSAARHGRARTAAAPKAVTIEDVAARAGVSISTVSNALNGRPERMRKETFRRIESVITALGFHPNRAARQLKIGHTQLLGLLVPSIANPSYGALAREVEVAAQDRHGYRVLLGNTYRSKEKEARYFDDLLSHGVRGVIIISSLADQAHVEAAIQRGLVPVSYDRRAPATQRSRIDYVGMDNARAARIAVEHLVAKGHRRLAFATAKGRTISRVEKLEGFDAATRAAGLEGRARVLEHDTATPYGDSEMTDLGRSLARKISMLKARPTGIVAINDMLAFGLIVGLREFGINVPQDVSVIGMDDLFLCTLFSPTLTTIRPPLRELGRTMVDRIIRRLSEPEIATGEFLLQPELIERESVATAPR